MQQLSILLTKMGQMEYEQLNPLYDLLSPEIKASKPVKKWVLTSPVWPQRLSEKSLPISLSKLLTAHRYPCIL